METRGYFDFDIPPVTPGRFLVASNSQVLSSSQQESLKTEGHLCSSCHELLGSPQHSRSPSFTCGVCKVPIYGRHIRALPVEKFQFIQTEANEGSLHFTQEGSLCTAVCSNCSETLYTQSDQFDAMNIPLEERVFVRPSPKLRLPCGKLGVDLVHNGDIGDYYDVWMDLPDDDYINLRTTPTEEESCVSTSPPPAKRQKMKKKGEDPLSTPSFMEAEESPITQRMVSYEFPSFNNEANLFMSPSTDN